jgi:hypothetical protein
VTLQSPRPATVALTPALNQTIKDWYTRVVTLSETKGLSERFFATLRMTLANGCSGTCTNVMWFD